MYKYGCDYPYVFVKLSGVKEPLKGVVRGVADHSLLTSRPYSLIVQTVRYGFAVVPISCVATDSDDLVTFVPSDAVDLLNRLTGAEVRVKGLSDIGGTTTCKAIGHVMFRDIEYHVVAPLVQQRKSLCYLVRAEDVVVAGLCNYNITSFVEVASCLYNGIVYHIVGTGSDDHFILLNSNDGTVIMAPMVGVQRI